MSYNDENLVILDCSDDGDDVFLSESASSATPDWLEAKLYSGFVKDGIIWSASCKLCKPTTVIRDRSTSNFRRHLKRSHPADWESLLTTATTRKRSRPGSSCSSTSTTIDAFVRNTKPYGTNHPIQLRINNAIHDFITGRMLAFHLVTCDEFRNVILAGDPCWKPLGLDGLHSLCERRMVQLNSKLKTLVEANKGYMSNQVDLWSDRRLRSFIGIFATAVNESFERQICLIGFKHVTDRHTGEHVAETYRSRVGKV